MSSKKKCCIEGCDRPFYARGWCEAHYDRWHTHGNPLAGGPFQDGRKNHPLYETWIGIKKRCENENNEAYKNYGARGILMYKPWREDFWQFAEYMPPKPYPEATIERIDNNGNYEPGNVKWATRVVQSRNKRNNCYLTAKGRTQLLTDWATEAGISHSAIWYRIKKLGWSEEDAVSIPSRVNGGNLHQKLTLKKCRLVTAHGRTQPLYVWAKETGINKSTLYYRLRRGLSPEEAIPVALTSGTS